MGADELPGLPGDAKPVEPKRRPAGRPPLKGNFRQFTENQDNVRGLTLERD